MSSSAGLWRETPLIRSQILSSRLGCEVYLKLESLQISGSFKGRGVSNFAKHAKEEHGDKAHLVIASGGNAGLAAASAARLLGLPITVYIPLGSAVMREPLIREGAEAIVGGENYDQAHDAASEAARTLPHRVLVPPFDHELVWQGHASMIREIHSQLPSGKKPAAILCSVGGAGLLGGVLMGCKSVGWDDVPVVGLETHGSSCFYYSLMSNRGKDLKPPSPQGSTTAQDPETGVSIVRLPGITSRASHLGARSPAPGVVKMALERGSVTSASVSDERAMDTALHFAADHQMLVELACATTLTPAYSPKLFERLVGPSTDPERVVIFIVCGGTKISLEEMQDYQRVLDVNASLGDVWIDGEIASGL